ncbi:MAG: ribosome-associated translation inhibitor RaiA [Candidatus Palauibacterales bacterium]|nr:ribosome-associated translation inhibitor RaiA [Candidatus Palauibacterales bacterium]
MQIIVAARHFDLSDNLKQHVRDKFGDIDKYDDRIRKVEVTLTEEKNRRDVDVLASVDRAGRIHAEAEDGDFRTAIDTARDRLARQIKRQRAQQREHQGPGDAPPPGTGATP